MRIGSDEWRTCSQRTFSKNWFWASRKLSAACETETAHFEAKRFYDRFLYIVDTISFQKRIESLWAADCYQTSSFIMVRIHWERGLTERVCFHLYSVYLINKMFHCKTAPRSLSLIVHLFVNCYFLFSLFYYYYSN